jgi:hypothetical protein
MPYASRWYFTVVLLLLLLLDEERVDQGAGRDGSLAVDSVDRTESLPT